MFTGGVIQRNVLVAPCFVVHANDIFKFIRQRTLLLFADGLKIVFTFKTASLNSSIAPVNEGLVLPNNFLAEWIVDFSGHKSSLVTYMPYSLRPILHVRASISAAHMVKVLGLQYFRCSWRMGQTISLLSLSCGPYSSV